MGRVLLVHDEFLRRSIALKELLPTPPGVDSSAQPTPVRQTGSMAARFLQEARITGQLEHPAIVPVYEVGRRQDGTLYYTMKLVRGKTLSQSLRDCKDLSDRLGLLQNFIDLMSRHRLCAQPGRDPSRREAGQRHGRAFGETVVLDWGLAKVQGTEDVNTKDLEEAFRCLRLDDESALSKTLFGRALAPRTTCRQNRRRAVSMRLMNVRTSIRLGRCCMKSSQAPPLIQAIAPGRSSTRSAEVVRFLSWKQPQVRRPN